MKIIAKLLFITAIVTLLYPFIGRLSQQFIAAAEPIGDYLQVYGGIYGVLAAFIIFVVWGQFTTTETAISKEASNLEVLAELLNFLDEGHAAQKALCRRLISHYAAVVASDEFSALAKGQESQQADKTFHTLLKEVHKLRTQISSSQDLEIYTHILTTIAEAVRLRDDRVTISKTRIPVTLWRLLQGVSYTLILSSTLLPVQNSLIGYFLLLLITLVCSLLLIVIADIDNPFQGVWTISTEPLNLLAAKHRS
ncbi:MAG: DUF4239 domain-containing protein [Acidobacteriota bacterium]